MNKLLILPVALACTGAIASSNIPITGSVESKCVIQTDTDGVYGNPTADKLSTAVSDGGVLPVIRYDIVTANAYKAVISHPDSFSSSPTLTDTVSWTGSTTLTNSSDSNMSAFNDNKVTYNNSSEFDLTIAGSAWFSVSSTAEYGYDKAFSSRCILCNGYSRVYSPVMRLSIILFLIGLSGYISAHQFTPTYPELSLSYVKGVYKADMLLFNSRQEISYYAIGVYDKDWKPVKFATENRIVKMQHLERKNITVYIREEDKEKALYICSKSKTLVDEAQTSIVTSRICSKIK